MYTAYLTDKDEDGNKPRYDDDQTWLVVERDGKEILRERDNGEHEDNTFNRDYAWVVPALLQAYQYGL